MSAILRVSGNAFDVERLLEAARFVTCKVFRKGEKVGSRKIVQVTSANIRVSEAGFDDFVTAVEDAIRFFEENASELRRMREIGVDTMLLDFAVARRETFTQSDVLPARLLKLAGDLGVDVCISQYPVSQAE